MQYPSMFSLEKNLSHILEKGHIKKVLDLWTGNWYFSVFCASYTCKVIAIDTQKMSPKYPEYLKSHPHIMFYQEDINDTNKSYMKDTYDLILLFNVVVFLDKKYFLEYLFPKYLERLNIWGTLCLTFFFEDDETMKSEQSLSFFDFKDLQPPTMHYAVQNTQDAYVEDFHKPYGKHFHHIWYIEIMRMEE